MHQEHVGVVGGGILGVAVARQLLAVRPQLQVTVLEKESALAVHQSGHNSGVVHAGVYYRPGSLKASLCRRGVALLEDFCAEHALAYDRCGKIIVAVDSAETSRLEELESRAVANGVPGIRRLDRSGLREIEPHVDGMGALHSPSTAVVDFAAVTRALAEDAARRGASVVTGSEVHRIRPDSGRVRVETPTGPYMFDRLVLCPGLQADRLARLAGADGDPRIVPFRGEYWLLRPERRHLVRSLVYPVPDPRYPFLGVHLTRRWDGEVLVGPNAVLALARQGYRRRDFSWHDVYETVTWPGFRRMAARHWHTGVREVASSFSRRAFAAGARRYVPELVSDDLLPGPSGVRAQAVARDGSLVDDFRVWSRGPVVAVRNAPSPAATSSLAIAEHLVALMYDGTPPAQ